MRAHDCDGSHAIGKAPFDSWPRDEICDQAVAEQRWFITLILWLITGHETDFRQWRCFISNNEQVAIYIVVFYQPTLKSKLSYIVLDNWVFPRRLQIFRATSVHQIFFITAQFSQKTHREGKRATKGKIKNWNHIKCVVLKDDATGTKLLNNISRGL